MDLPCLRRYRRARASFEGGQARALERTHDGQAQVQELDLDLGRRIAVGAMVGLVQAAAERGPVTETLHGDRHRVLLNETADVDGPVLDRPPHPRHEPFASTREL